MRKNCAIVTAVLGLIGTACLMAAVGLWSETTRVDDMLIVPAVIFLFAALAVAPGILLGDDV